MKICLGYTSALEYWRRNDLFSREHIIKIAPSTLSAPNRGLLEKAQFELEDCQTPLHLVVFERVKRRNLSNSVCHVIVGSIPQRSFVNHSSHVAISSPEACFLQLASSLSLIELIQVGFELCGSYAIDPKSGSLLVRFPRTNVLGIARYLEKAKGIHGLVKAKRALRYVCENSASPMETKLTLLMSLPTSLGGYGLPKPQLNKEVEIDKGWRTKNYRCDALWSLALPEQRTLQSLVLEYDSHAFHAEQEKMQLDSRRRVQLEKERMHVLSVTKQQIYDPAAFDNLAHVVAKYLRFRFRSTRSDLQQRRMLLRKKLDLP